MSADCLSGTGHLRDVCISQCVKSSCYNKEYPQSWDKCWSDCCNQHKQPGPHDGYSCVYKSGMSRCMTGEPYGCKIGDPDCYSTQEECGKSCGGIHYGGIHYGGIHDGYSCVNKSGMSRCMTGEPYGCKIGDPDCYSTQEECGKSCGGIHDGYSCVYKSGMSRCMTGEPYGCKIGDPDCYSTQEECDTSCGKSLSVEKFQLLGKKDKKLSPIIIGIVVLILLIILGILIYSFSKKSSSRRK
jgi:hypothetical protein